MESITNLRDLQRAIANHKVSLIVGSGFSKNVSPLFPDWKQLLFDLVCELYENEIKQLIAHVKPRQREAARKKAVTKIIGAKGYLRVVSEYIERKGMEEAIVSYIEDRTPVIHAEDGNYYLIQNGSRVQLLPRQLRLHRLLLGLPWNNVYTTNYDPLLEASVNVNTFAEKNQENIALRKQISDLDAAIQQIEEELQKLIEEKDGIESELKDLENKNPLEKEGPEVAERRKQLMELTGPIAKKRMALNVEKSNRRDLQNEHDRNESIINQSYTVVRSGPELGLKRTKNIIKLHGSLRSEHERNSNTYGFDGDARKQYVISVEHYKQYPEKHEAFMQLMRISLLQESFCLIGFSGDDPNFLEWIGWVRDLLERSKTTGNTSGYKIYLIDVNNEPVPTDRAMFFENHRIARVSITMPTVIDFLEQETNSKIDLANSFGSAIELFLSYLFNHNQLFLPVVPKDTTLASKWRHAWEKLFDPQSPMHVKFDEIPNATQEIMRLGQKIGKIDLNGWDTHSQLQFLTDYRSSGLENEVPLQSQVDELISQAILKLNIPGPFLIDQGALNKVRHILGVTFERDRIIADPLGADMPSDEHNKLLKLAFNFQFSALKEASTSWNPPIRSLHVKAGFLSLFDPQQAVDILNKQISSSELTEQDRMSSYELLVFVKEGSSMQSDTGHLRDQVKVYENGGYSSLFKKLDKLVEAIEGKKDAVSPYGEDRFTVSHIIFGQSSPGAKEALQFLALLADYGVQANLHYSAIINSEEFYKVYRIGIKYSPMPFIYYAVQMRSEKVVRRMGQDLIRVDEIRERLPDILTCLLNAFKDIPTIQKNSLLTLASELFNGIQPSSWEEEFYRIWEILLAEKIVFQRGPNADQGFVRSAIRYIESSRLTFKIIIDLLNNSSTHPSEVISLLYYLNRNYLLASMASQEKPEGFLEAVDRIIKEIPTRTEDTIFILGNLHRFLSESQQQAIKNQLIGNKFDGIVTPNIFRIILVFSDHDSGIHKNLLSAALSHESLWPNGIQGDKVSTPTAIMSFMDLTNKGNPQSGMILEKADIFAVFDKLDESAKGIKKVLEREGPGPDYTFVLGEMYAFLEGYNETLLSYGNYADVLTFVKDNYIKERQFGQVASGLFNSEKNAVVLALAELSDSVVRGKPDTYSVQILLNKILLHAEPGVEASLNYLAAWIQDEKNHHLFRPFEQVLKDIIDKYWSFALPNSDVPFIKEMMVQISWGMKKMGIEAPAIPNWLEYAEKSPFNNVRQWYSMVSSQA